MTTTSARPGLREAGLSQGLRLLTTAGGPVQSPRVGPGQTGEGESPCPLLRTRPQLLALGLRLRLDSTAPGPPVTRPGTHGATVPALVVTDSTLWDVLATNIM